MGSMGKGTGVMLVDAAERARVEGQVAESARRREGREVRVDLEGLIEQGKGKREKRGMLFFFSRDGLSTTTTNLR